MSLVSRDQVEAKLREYKELIRSIHETSSSRRRQVSMPATTRESSRLPTSRMRVQPVKKHPQPKQSQPQSTHRVSFEVCGVGLVPSARPLHRHSARSLGSMSSSSSRQPPPLVPIQSNKNSTPRVLITDTDVSNQLRDFLLEN